MYYSHRTFCDQGTGSVDIEHALIPGTRSMATERVLLLAQGILKIVKPKLAPKTCQNQTQRPPENEKTLDDCPGPKKTEFGRPCSSKMHAQRDQIDPPKRGQDHPKSRFYTMSQGTMILGTV